MVLQIGAFKDRKNAVNLLKFFKDKIDDNFFIKDNVVSNNELIYKLFAGPF